MYSDAKPQVENPPIEMPEKRKSPSYSPEDGEHYFHLMLSLRKAAIEMNRVLDEHEDCPGCNLCFECKGQVYTIELFEDMYETVVLPDLLWRVNDALGFGRKPTEGEPASADAAPSPAPTLPAPDFELSAVKTRPYWLS